MSNLLGLDDNKTSSSPGEIGPDTTELEARLKGGANWFYWIAGLSLVNAVVYMSGSDWVFLAGLGLTQVVAVIVDAAIDNGAPAAMKAVAIVVNLVLVIVFALFGYFANKRFATAFIVGIVLYVLDGLLLLLLGVLLSAGFHVFALIFIIRGFLACRTLNAYSAATQPIQAPPPPPANL